MRQPKKFNPEPFPYHHELELRINTLTNLGVGLGRVDNWVVMVPFALPGELVKVRIYRNHKSYSEGDLVEVIEASPDRVEPMCPLFANCGGCQYQNFSYDKQLEWKQTQISELFERLAGIKHPVNPTIGSPKEYFYRSKITPHFRRPFEEDGEKDMPIGFLKQGTRHSIVDVSHCPIATEAINEALPIERAKVQSGERKFKKGGTLLFRDTLEGVTVDPKKTVSEKVGDLTFQFIAGDFFQNNSFILPKMVDYALGKVKVEGINYFIDTYCGVGVFALSAAKHFEEVAGVEVNAAAIKFAKRNAAANEIYNVSFLEGEAEHIFREVKFPSDETAILLDPPRKGCDELFIKQLLEFNPKRIVYVSCDPSTQARDLQLLLAGGYELTDVQPFDLFPQTRHIENVIVLSRA